MDHGLKPEQLYRRCDPAQFDFDTTAELPDLNEIIGQDRALEAVRFGIAMASAGYNIYALGPPGIGKHTLITQVLAECAQQRQPPRDWCYVNNFDDQRRPRALSLPPGRGRALRDDVARLVEDLKHLVPAAFESEDYRARTQEIEQDIKDKQDQAVAALQREARDKGIELLRSPTGFVFAPLREGEALNPEEFERLPQKEQDAISATVARLQEQMRGIIRQVPQWRQDGRNRLLALNREVAISAVEHPFCHLRDKYADLPPVTAYLDAAQEDIISNIDEFRQQEDGTPAAPGFVGERPFFRRYVINLLVERGNEPGAPVLYEDNPAYQNLVGAMEHMAMMGALITDFSLIKAGALHRANGGYLLLDAHKILTQPFSWEALKRALRSRELRLEPAERMLGLMSTVSLEPEPIPLDIKVILIGDRMLYYLLCEYDPEFAELFKVAADFEEALDRTVESQQRVARLIATMARRHQLLPFNRHAVARIIERGSRVIEDADKLPTHLRSLADLLQESDHFARAAGSRAVDASHVQKAVDGQVRRADRLRGRLQEAIERGIILVASTGGATGQVNGLTVIEMGGYAFGIPHRITARVRLGEGEVIDIEREVELGGPLHSKGVLILGGFLGERYAADLPLSLSASLVIEQSYGQIEGDSASSAELYALLSALSGLPVRQSLAVTGSVNQLGEIQAIGGVNEKIEGFYEVCKRRGLDGSHGVLIPVTNVQHLMLDGEVVEAVRQGVFRIHPVATVDEGISLLTGVSAGKADDDGDFPPDSVNGRVQQRLRHWAQLRQAFGEHGKDRELDGVIR